MANRNLSPYQFQSVPGDKLSEIYAYEKGKKREGPVGQLSWNSLSGEVSSVAVHPDHQNKGLATEMYKRASKSVKLRKPPENTITSDGKAWIGYLEKTYGQA